MILIVTHEEPEPPMRRDEEPAGTMNRQEENILSIMLF